MISNLPFYWVAATFYAVRSSRLHKQRERDLNWVKLLGKGPSWANPQNFTPNGTTLFFTSKEWIGQEQ